MTADHTNRIEQLEGLRNVRTAEDFYEKLAAGKVASASSSPNGPVQQYIPVPITIKAQLGSPVRIQALTRLMSVVLDLHSNRPRWLLGRLQLR